MKVYMGSTQIKSQKTAMEVMDVLRRSGAQQIAVDYGAGGKIVGMRFIFPIANKPVCFMLPLRIEGLKKVMRSNNKEQVERTAWRQLLRWVQSQLAMIEVGTLHAAEVYAPYVVMPNGKLMGEMLLEHGSPKELAREVLAGSGLLISA